MSWTNKFGGHMKIRGDVWAGGTIYAGSTQDTASLSREAASRLLARGDLAVAGTTGLRGAARVDGALTMAGGGTLSSAQVLDLGAGTVVLRAGAGSPATMTNGEVYLQNAAGGTSRLYYRSNGTTYFLTASGTA